MKPSSLQLKVIFWLEVSEREEIPHKKLSIFFFKHFWACKIYFFKLP